MTREEAIAYIREWLKDEYALNSKDKEVLNITIKALDQEPCEDCISRQTVLDEISDYNNDLDYTTEELCDRITRMSSVKPQAPVLDKIRDEIEQLPITDTAIRLITEIINKYKVESERFNTNYCLDYSADMKEEEK